MKKIALIAIILLLGFPQQSLCALYGEGNITWGLGLYASDVPDSDQDWAHATSYLHWRVEDPSETGLWTYTYTFHVSEKDISHVIIEVSDSFIAANIKTGTTSTPELDTYGPPGVDNPSNSNVGMPGFMYGIKWEGLDGLTEWTWVLVTDRAPMWGDFYAVDGKTPGEQVYAYNTGFGSADGDMVLVPDTTVVPIPGAVWLLGSGLLGLVAIRRRMRK